MPPLTVRSKARINQTFDSQAPEVLGPLLPSDRHDPGYDSIFEGGRSLRRDEHRPHNQQKIHLELGEGGAGQESKGMGC